MAEDIISLADARAQGLKHYFNGKPCPRGHISKRFVISQGCCECARERIAEKRAADPEYEREKSRRWNEANRERRREISRKHRALHREERNAQDRERRSGHQREAILARRRELRNLNSDHQKQVDRAWKHANREKLNAQQRERYAKDPEKERERNKLYRAQNADALKERVHERKYWREWRSKNLEHARAYARRYYVEKPNKTASIHKRRAQKKQAEGTHTAADLAAILKAQNHRCAYCRADLRKVKRHVDHIQPLLKGGSNDRTNLQFLCEPCNLSKAAKDPIEFAQELGRLL